MQLLLPAVIEAPRLNTIHNLDAMELLKRMPSQSVNCIVTSPPYFGLRDYGMPGQIGLEETPQQFVAKLVELFREARRVLRDDGTFWLNLGDSYARDPKGSVDNGTSGLAQGAKGQHVKTPPGLGKGIEYGVVHKNLLGIPWRVAFALQDDGWILRSEIIWHKPNPMPESVTDRPTKAHETIFLFAKSQKYFYDADAIREECIDNTIHIDKKTRGTQGYSLASGSTSRPQRDSNGGLGSNELGRNKRSVWTVNTEPTPYAHFATFPTKLIEPMILAGCPDKTCSKCGAPWIREIEISGGTIGKSWHNHENDLEAGMSQYSGLSGGVGNAKDNNGKPYTRQTVGFKPTCDCNADTRPGVVYDPFMGSGTTALVARQHGRNYIGSELNPDYTAIARERLRLPFDEREYTPPDKPLPRIVIQVGDVQLEQTVMFEDAS